MGEGIAGDLPPDPQVIKARLSCPQADLDISQTFAISKLGEGHAEVLVPAGKADHLVIAVVSGPGQTGIAVIPLLPTSNAKLRASPTKACLLAQ